jgi:hypothetical protein
VCESLSIEAITVRCYIAMYLYHSSECLVTLAVQGPPFGTACLIPTPSIGCLALNCVMEREKGIDVTLLYTRYFGCSTTFLLSTLQFLVCIRRATVEGCQMLLRASQSPMVSLFCVEILCARELRLGKRERGSGRSRDKRAFLSVATLISASVKENDQVSISALDLAARHSISGLVDRIDINLNLNLITPSTL